MDVCMYVSTYAHIHTYARTHTHIHPREPLLQAPSPSPLISGRNRFGFGSGFFFENSSVRFGPVSLPTRFSRGN